MTFTRTSLPHSFKPYKKLLVCSNSLFDGGHIVSIGDVIPLIVGEGVKPQVWLQALADTGGKEFTTVVENSVSKHPSVEVREVSDSLVISVHGKSVLRIRQTSQHNAEIDLMDLRPVGLNLYGDSSSMHVGGGTFSRNSMRGGGILIGLG